jgi:catechol 2,3-dioxygenase-like lactoylglutathione lyase family enzyme
MRLDHIAYRVADRKAAAAFFVSAFGYRIADEFRIKFDNGESAKCFALAPPERMSEEQLRSFDVATKVFVPDSPKATFHLAPEVFVSEGTPDSIVGKWVAERGGIGGLHHLAYEVEDVDEQMQDWRMRGLAEFTTEEPISNTGDLVQCFTKVHPITGIIYEFIKRGANNKGFNVDSVRDLMESTQ